MEYKLSDVFDLQMGKTPDRSNLSYWENGTEQWIAIADLSESGKYIEHTSECITMSAVKETGIKIIPENTVIMSFKLSIGKVAITPRAMYSNEAIMAFVNKNILKIDPSYLYYLLMNRKWDDGTNKAVMGKTLNKGTLSNMRISFHDAQEQRSIAAVLDKVQEVIFAKQKQIEKLELFIQARFVEMFGDPVCNEKNWDMYCLSDVCEKLTDGTHFSPESFSEGEFRYVTAKNIKKDGFDFSNITYVTTETHREIYERCNPEFGDVLYIKDGATTGIAIINSLHDQFTMLSSIALLKQKRDMVNGIFLCGVLNNSSMYHSIRSNMGGAAITRLTIAKIEKFNIPVPPLYLQQQFADFVTRVDKSKVVIQKSIDKLQLLFDSLMQQYFG